MPRPSFEPTAEQQTKVQVLAAHGIRHDEIALELEIAPKTLRKHFRKELNRGAVRALREVRKTLFSKATSGRDTRATIHADRRWTGICARQSEAEGQSMPPPQIIIVQESEEGPKGDEQ